MPAYEFHCGSCEAARNVRINYARSRTLELICVACGGTMRVAPVLNVNVQRFAATAVEAAPAAASRSCGHAYACRCNAVRLTGPNPFASRASSVG